MRTSWRCPDESLSPMSRLSRSLLPPQLPQHKAARLPALMRVATQAGASPDPSHLPLCRVSRTPHLTSSCTLQHPSRVPL